MFATDMTSVTNNVPGSDCMPRYTNNLGLCGTDVSTVWILFEKWYLNDFNLLRKKYANRYQISNMHELVSSPSISTDVYLQIFRFGKILSQRMQNLKRSPRSHCRALENHGDMSQ